MIRLLELRNERGMSQRDMAKQLNISQGTYNNWENSNTQPSIEQLIELARFFEVSVDYLIGNADDTGTVSSGRRLTRDEEGALLLYRGLSERNRGAIRNLMANLDR